MDWTYFMDFFTEEYIIREVAPNAGGIFYLVLYKDKDGEEHFYEHKKITDFDKAIKLVKKLETKRFEKHLNNEMKRYKFRSGFISDKNKV